jgi:hypothetical protein
MPSRAKVSGGWRRRKARTSSDGGAGKVPGFPGTITTRAQLNDIVQRIIWTAGPQHAAVNFPQTEFTTFVPNAPGAITAQPLSGVVNERALVGLLPAKVPTAAQVQISYALAGYHYANRGRYSANAQLLASGFRSLVCGRLAPGVYKHGECGPL